MKNQAFRAECIAFSKLAFSERLQNTTLQNATPSAPKAYFYIFMQYLLAGLRNVQIASEVLQTKAKVCVSYGGLCISESRCFEAL